MIYIISDLHLGADNCQAEKILKFLQEKVNNSECETLILNGDVLDNLNIRLKKKHWAILSYLRKISDEVKLIWVCGNHDGPDSESVAHLIGAEFVDEYRFEKNGVKYICIHGDCYDDYVANYYWLTVIADWIYGLAQKIDRTHNLARFLKRSSKTFLRNASQIRERALAYCESIGYNYIVLGHSHHAEKIGSYINDGSWVESPSYFIKIDEFPTLEEF